MRYYFIIKKVDKFFKAPEVIYYWDGENWDLNFHKIEEFLTQELAERELAIRLKPGEFGQIEKIYVKDL